MSDGMDGMGLSYTAVTPRASLQSDANNKVLTRKAKNVKASQAAAIHAFHKHCKTKKVQFTKESV